MTAFLYDEVQWSLIHRSSFPSPHPISYGQEGSGLELCLVYNPSGGFLPPSQAGLEAKYKQELMDQFGIRFNKLYTITNMPIKRFADFLSM